MKELNTTEHTICQLLSNSLFGNTLTLSDEVDWHAVYQEMALHAILGVVREIIPSLPLPQKIRTAWDKQNYQIIARSVQIAAGQSELIQLLCENDIRYAILKGTAAAHYYPIEYTRSLGDVDFIVDEENYERTLKLLQGNGYIPSFEHEDNYRHESFNKDGIHYECHHLFADNSFSHAAKIDELILSNIENVALAETPYGSFMTLPTAVNGLVLLEHIAIHIKAGIGLRQIIDWLLYADQYLSDAQWEGENGRVIRESGLDTLAKVVTRAGQLYFGLNPKLTWCEDVSEKACLDLTKLVFAYGNFGNKNTIDDKVVVVAYKYRKNLFQQLNNSGEHNWKILHQYPWLKPLAPIYQIGRYTKQVLTTKGAFKAVFANRKATDERISIMQELGLD